jgi:hypothetical protein
MKTVVVVLLAGCLVTGAGIEARLAAQEQRRALAGRPLADVLRELQVSGLKIVFSSELVRPGMRVQKEPASTSDRQILDEVLKPHGLGVQSGPRGMLLVVRSNPRQPANVTGPTRTTVRGIVVDARSAAPLPGVLVRVAAADRAAVSDADGRFELGDVPAGVTEIMATLVGYSLARPEIDVPPAGILEVAIVLSDGTGTYAEEITVTGDRFRGGATGVPAAMLLNSADLLELRGVLSDDPLRAVQALPPVMTGNDFRSEFSVRGTDFRHVGLTVDGMGHGWPVHTVRDDLSGGSVALINGDVVDTMTLVTGVYPQDRPARTGAWLDMSIREGSRVKTQAHGAVSMTSASLVMDGPVGSAQRGSWLVSARQSYLQWLLQRIDPEGSTTFGFSDLQGKLVFDVTPRQQVQATVVSGRSLLEQDRIEPDVNFVRRGSAHASMLVLGWRSTIGESAAASQQFAVTGYSYLNGTVSGTTIAGGSGTEISYHADVSMAVRPQTILRFGTHLERQSADQEATRFIGLGTENWIPRTESIDGSRALASAHARVSHSFPHGVAVDGGLLFTHSSSSEASPWLTATLPLGSVALRAGAGIYRQHPGLDQTVGSFAGADVRPERSFHADAAVEYAWRPETRMQVAFYHRRERDALRLEGDEYQLVQGVVRTPSLTPLWANALAGTSRGVELMVQRRAAAGLTGWVSYAYSHTRYEDRLTREAFPSDYDQRHTFSAYGQYRVSPVTSFSAKFRFGSNFPIPGYFERRNGGLFVGSERNTQRLPTYARLDVRANRAFNFETRRLTLFVEIVNLLGRTNYAADAFRVLSSGEVVGTTQHLFPFLPTAGISIDF